MTAHKGSLLGRMLWALIIGGGFGTIWLAVAMIGGEFLVAQWRSGDGGFVRGRIPEQLIISTDGRPLVRGTFVKGQQAGYRRLDGTPVNDASTIRQADSLQVWHMREPNQVDAPYFFLNALGGRDWDWRLRAFLDELHPDNVWYFVHDGRTDGAGYFVGYDKVEKRRLGFIGQSGFSLDCPPQKDWFPVERHLVRSPLLKLWTSIGVSKGWLGAELDSLEKSPIPPHLVFVPSGRELKQVDLSTRTVRTVVTTDELIEGVRVAGHLTPLDTLGVLPTDQAADVSGKSANPKEPSDGARGASKAGEARSNDAAVAAMTAHKIHVLDRDCRQLAVFATPAEARGEVELYFRQGWATALVPWVTTSDHKLMRREMLYKIAADDTFRDGKLVESVQRVEPPWSERSDSVMLPVALPSPATLLFVEPLVIARTELSDGYLGGFSVMLRESGLILPVLATLTVFLAVMTWRRCAAYSLSLGERVAWSAFVVLFGLSGYVGFRLHRPWPLRDECPKCHAQTVLEHGLCTRCGEGFPGPIFKGTEVFA
jgi:hypothetical protein